MVMTRRSPGATGRLHRVLITGGSGFLGQNLVQKLVDTGRYEVSVFDLSPFPKPGVCTSIKGNLLDYQQVESAIAGMDVVIHTATLAVTGKNATSHGPMYQVNVVGTGNVIKACIATGCRNLVYTSSASVAWDGTDYYGVDERRPYPTKFPDFYSQTKKEAEVLVLEADGVQGLRTVSLRPSGIFGEGDLLMAPTTVKQCRRGKMKFIIGDGKNVMDWTYVGNVSDAHILAADALIARKTHLCGKAYFITNDDPRPMWGFLSKTLEGLGYPAEMRPRIKLPFLLIWFIASIVEVVLRFLRFLGVDASTDFTVFRITVTAKNRHYSCEAAKRDLGYVPAVSVDEGLRRMIASMPHLRKEVMDREDAKAKISSSATKATKTSTPASMRKSPRKATPSKRR